MPTHRELANAIRALTMDAVQKANSGHPGAPMGMADIAEVLWRDVLKFNPGNPTWLDRDRFVLSNGHASMLLYSVLHLTGYPLAMEEMKNFRQFGSKTPGHPERELHLGIETTTGPLGQGFANAVGMALAERSLAATFNRPGHTIVDHHTYVFMGDGCMMEGISHEAASFAGTQKLGKLIAVYDNNGISIDGKVVGWFDDDTAQRFEAYGWHVIGACRRSEQRGRGGGVCRGPRRHRPAVADLRADDDWLGCPEQAGHRRPCTAKRWATEEIAATRRDLGWTSPPFEIPADIAAAWDHARQGSARGAAMARAIRRLQQEFPALAAELERRMAGDLPEGFDELLRATTLHAQSEGKALATRQSSQATFNSIGPALPELLGGSADLTPSNGTLRKDSITLNDATPGGNYIHFGVREFGMSAIMNGITGARRLHSLRRHVPDVLRLRAQCTAHGGAHAACAWFSSTPTTRSASARMVRRINRSSSWRVCGPFRIWTCGAPAMRPRPPRPGPRRWRIATGRRASY